MDSRRASSRAAARPSTIQEYKTALLKLGVTLPASTARLEKYQELWGKYNATDRSSPHSPPARRVASVGSDATPRRAVGGDGDASVAAYVHVWCLLSAFDVYNRRETPSLAVPGPDPLAVAHVAGALFSLAFAFPSRRAAVAAAVLGRAVVFFFSLPFVWDSDYWAYLTDLTLLLYTLGLRVPLRRTVLGQM